MVVGVAGLGTAMGWDMAWAATRHGDCMGRRWVGGLVMVGIRMGTGMADTDLADTDMETMDMETMDLATAGWAIVGGVAMRISPSAFISRTVTDIRISARV